MGGPIEQPAIENGDDFVNRIGELQPAIFHMDMGIGQPGDAAIDIGELRHSDAFVKADFAATWAPYSG